MFAPFVGVVLAAAARSQRLVAVAVATVGLFLLTGAELSARHGRRADVGCAFCLRLLDLSSAGAFAQRFDIVALNAVQFAVVALFASRSCVVAGLGDGRGRRRSFAVDLHRGRVLGAVALRPPALGPALRRAEPGRVILLLEPVFAGILGYVVGERLGVAGYLGAVVILAGILVAESRAWRRGRADDVT